MYKPYTLVLDISYRPVTFINGIKGFIIAHQKRGLALDTYPKEIFVLRTIKEEYQIPAVIRLNILYKHFESLPSKLAIFYRDMFMCAYCGKVCSDDEVTIDHIIPKSRGGNWSWENLVTCCKDCNQLKGNLTPEEAGMKLRFKPYRPDRFEIAYYKCYKYFHPWFVKSCLSMWVSRKFTQKVGGKYYV